MIQHTDVLAGFEGWRFGNCELRPHLQELKVNGKPRPLPPKALDLLLFLIRERHRVVMHNDLVARFWPNARVSGRVLPATIAKLRAAIDSDSRQWGHETSAIRTVHRTGYKFVAPLQAIEYEAPRAVVRRSSGSPQAATTAPTDRLRLGMLRCHNSTGLSSLDWAETGLMALAGHALARDPRLQVVSTETLVKWPRADLHDLRTEADLQRLMATLDLHVLVRCSLHQQGDTCRLNYTLLAPGMWPRRGEAPVTAGEAATPAAAAAKGAETVDAEPADPANATKLDNTQTVTASAHTPQALARHLAQAVEGLLFGEQAAAMQLAYEDEFSNLAFARAVALFANGDYDGAANLMAVVCNMQPGSLAAEGWRLRAWAHANDPRAAAASVDFLARARATGDPLILATAEAAMGEQTYV